MIEPESISPSELKDRTSSGKLFACYAGIKYLLYDDGECIFEIMGGPVNGYHLSNGGGYQGIEDIFVFLDQIKTKYPDVADWFLFNIGKFL